MMDGEELEQFLCTCYHTKIILDCRYVIRWLEAVINQYQLSWGYVISKIYTAPSQGSGRRYNIAG